LKPPCKHFETALQAYSVFFHGGGTDDEAAAATDAVKAIAQKIIAVPPVTDISVMRLKARVYLWAESTDLEKLAAEGGDWPSEAVDEKYDACNRVANTRARTLSGVLAKLAFIAPDFDDESASELPGDVGTSPEILFSVAVDFKALKAGEARS
jgi:hypothetical protein